jgi:hypothetical protein
LHLLGDLGFPHIPCFLLLVIHRNIVTRHRHRRRPPPPPPPPRARVLSFTRACSSPSPLLCASTGPCSSTGRLPAGTGFDLVAGTRFHSGGGYRFQLGSGSRFCNARALCPPGRPRMTAIDYVDKQLDLISWTLFPLTCCTTKLPALFVFIIGLWPQIWVPKPNNGCRDGSKLGYNSHWTTRSSKFRGGGRLWFHRKWRDLASPTVF